MKNLPANTDKEEIKSLFEKHGHIARFLMPQHGITALVDFIEPFEAKKAFTKLAYSQFKSAPLYLEWAPENVFLKSAPKTETEQNVVKEINKREENIPVPEANVSQTPEESKDDVTETAEPENDTTLFVKNLNSRTTEQSLKEVIIFLIAM